MPLRALSSSVRCPSAGKGSRELQVKLKRLPQAKNQGTLLDKASSRHPRGEPFAPSPRDSIRLRFRRATPLAKNSPGGPLRAGTGLKSPPGNKRSNNRFAKCCYRDSAC